MDEKNYNEHLFIIEKMDKDAKLPTKATDESIGYDLYAFSDFNVPAGSRVLHGLKLKFTVPVGCYGRIAPKSGLAFKNGIDVGGGVVDRDYQEEVSVMLFNHSDTSYYFKKGQKIAQVILEVAKTTDIKEVDDIKKYYKTSNRVGGFGSTGL
jgi:deoxyuridine 5'-triphosphate nucleotidohydrolase